MDAASLFNGTMLRPQPCSYHHSVEIWPVLACIGTLVVLASTGLIIVCLGPSNIHQTVNIDTSILSTSMCPSHPEPDHQTQALLAYTVKLFQGCISPKQSHTQPQTHTSKLTSTSTRSRLGRNRHHGNQPVSRSHMCSGKGAPASAV